MIFLRSLVFNIIYISTTIIIGVMITPALLFPRRPYAMIVRAYFYYVHLLEKYLLGLNYEVRGREHLPVGTPFIVAGKHQSAFETLKLPLLFDQPVVILKRELLWIPIWGWYAAKAGMIGINRGNPRVALEKMQKDVGQALANGHTIVIFPQGTRVRPTDTPVDKPYKRGIYELYAAHQVPVVPMAVNTGLYYPKNAFLKRSGTAVLQFLPPLPPGLDKESFMDALVNGVEQTSNNLMITPSPNSGPKILPNIIAALILIITIYTALWFGVASLFQSQIKQAWLNAVDQGTALSLPLPHITGFPGPYRLTWSGTINTPKIITSIPKLQVTFWPLPYTAMTIEMPNGVRLAGPGLGKPIEFSNLRVGIEIPRYFPTKWTRQEVQNLHDRGVTYRLLSLNGVGPKLGDIAPIFSGNGTVDFDGQLQPRARVTLRLRDPEKIIDHIRPMLRPLEQSLLVGLVKSMTQKSGTTKILPITLGLKNQGVYAGPLLISRIPWQYWPDDASEAGAKPPPEIRRVRAPRP